MSYTSDILALNPVAFWKLDDASGAATAADAGPSGFGMTLFGSPSFGATGFVSGLNTSVQVPAGSMLYYNPVASSPLDATTAITVCGWFSLDSIATLNSQTLFARTNGFSILTSANASVSSSFTATGAPAVYKNGAGGYASEFAAGDVAFLALTWSATTGLAKWVVNGVLEGMWVRDTPLPSNSGSAGRYKIFESSDSSRPTMRASGVAVFNKELSVGQLRALCAANTSFTPAAFGLQHQPATISNIVGAGIDGGNLSINGTNVTKANGFAYRPDQYATEVCHRGAVVLNTSNYKTLLPYEVARSIREFIVCKTQRGTSRGNFNANYLDSSGILHSSLFTNDAWQLNWTVMEMISGIAALHRWSLAPADDSLVRIVSSLMEMILSSATNGRLVPGSVVDDFVMYEMSWALLMLKGHVDPTSYARWVAALEAHMNHWLVPANLQWYINGNRELQVAVACYATYLITGKQQWLQAYTAQWLKTIAPPINGQGSAAVGSAAGDAGAAGFGLKDANNVLITDPSTLNDTTSKCFFGESTGTALPGLDWDYLSNQTSMMIRLYTMTKDTTHRKILNGCVNLYMDRLNTTTWVYDYTGGTRHTGASTTRAMFIEYLQISGLRPDLTVDCSTHWPIARNLVTSSLSGSDLNIHRDIGGDFGSVLLASSQWPGIPS